MLQQLMILNPAHEYRGMKIEPYETTQLGYAPDKYSHDRGGHVRVKHARRRLSAWRVVDPEGYARIFDTLEKAKAWIDSSGWAQNPDIRRNPDEYGRALLAETMKEVRQRVSAETIKKSWGIRSRGGLGYAEFHIPPTPEFPEGFYYHDQDMSVAEIKAEGWEAALRQLSRENHPGFPPERSNPGHGFGMPGGPAHKFRLPRFHPGVIVRLATGRAELIQKYTGDSDGRGEWLVRWVDGPLAGGVVFKFLARNTPIDNPAPAWHRSAGREYAARVRADESAGHGGAAEYWQGALAAESRALAVENPDKPRLAFKDIQRELYARWDKYIRLLLAENNLKVEAVTTPVAAWNIAHKLDIPREAYHLGLNDRHIETALRKLLPYAWTPRQGNPSGKGAAAGFRMFHDADPDKAYKVSVPEGFPRKLYMLGRLAKLVTTRGTVRGGVLAAGAGDRMFVLGASKSLAGSARAVQVEYIPPRNSRKAGALYYHKFTHAPLVQRHGSGGNYTIAGKGVKLTPRGITG